MAIENHGSGRIFWITVDCMIIIATLAGNVLTLCAIKLSRKLSSMTSNRYIFSLAISDLMVGLSLPFHMVFYFKHDFGSNKNMCLMRFVLIIFACASSIFNLLFIAADRYVAILHPLHYNRYMTKELAKILIILGKIIPLVMATIPLYLNTWRVGVSCEIDNILYKSYISFVLTPLFATVWIAMFFVYIRIWREAVGHTKRLKTIANFQNLPGVNDSKSVQVVLIILGCFSLFWLPYFVIINWMLLDRNNRQPYIYETAFTMAIANSCVNPIVYAWKNTSFRRAFLCILRCQSPNLLTQKVSFMTNHVPSKKNSIENICEAEEGEKCSEECGEKITNIELGTELGKASYSSSDLIEKDIDGSVNTTVTTII